MQIDPSVPAGQICRPGHQQQQQFGGCQVDLTGTSTFNGTILDGIASGTRTTNVTVSGGGSLTLTGANTYSGGTTLQAGKLTAANAGAWRQQFAADARRRHAGSGRRLQPGYQRL